MTAIAHVSIPADNPQRAAAILAEIMSGEAMPFPPAGTDSWMAWSGDGAVEIEVSRRGLAVAYGKNQAEWRADGVQRQLSESHIALCVERTAADVLEIARKAGWPARHCERGGGVFSLTEVWVESAFMIEVLDSAQTACYRERVTPQSWKQFLREMQSTS